jgi:hypothetical protein
MIRFALRSAATAFAALSLITGAACAQGQAQKTPYPSMAPLAQYLITDRRSEIALAQSAAPPAIALHATLVCCKGAG